MPVRAWFPTQIYDAALEPRGAGAFNRELLAEILRIREVDDDGRRWSKRHYPGGYTSYHSMAHLHRTSSTFGELEKRLARHVRAFANVLDFEMTGRTLDMTDCWVSIMPQHTAHGLHLHPNSTLSGSYYVQTPRASPPIKFEDPRLPSFMAAPPRTPESRPANRKFIYYPVKAGRLILFESWLRHEVGANPSDAERIAVSFNFAWF